MLRSTKFTERTGFPSLPVLLAGISIALSVGLVVIAAAQGGKPSTKRLRGEQVAQIVGPLAAAMEPEHVEGELLVKFAPGLKSETLARSAHARIGARLIKRFSSTGWEHVRLPAGLGLSAALSLYRQMSGVLAVQPNYIYHPSATPDDTFFASQYGMQRIQAPAAWDTNTGSNAVVVAVIDTGIYYPHEDLSANMWRNPGETGPDANGNDKATNGIDDDGDGYVDDVYGIDTINHDSNPIDDRGHGTHCAGIIGAAGNNGKGVTGVNWNVQLMALKFISQAGQGTTDGAIECFDYIMKMKQRGVNVRVTNNSYGGDADFALKDAMDVAGDAGVLNVCAAGNAATNIDVSPFYPAAFNSPSIITVAASDQNDNAASFTNYGVTSVDLAAPGVSVYSTVSDGPMYDYLSGTSMSSPHVAGAAALLLAQYPSLSVASLKATLINTVDVLPQWSGKVASGGRLNVARALQAPTVCTFALSPGNQSFAPVGGSGTINVGAAGGCEWAAKSNANWLTFTSGSTGSGNGMIGYTIAANTGGTTRNATVTVADQSFTVTQFATGVSIGGTVMDESAAGLGNVSVQLRSTQLNLLQTMQTDERGRFQFDALPEGYDYIVQPSLDGYTFSPSIQSINNLAADHSNINFTAFPIQCTFSLSSSSQHFAAGAGSGFFSLSTQQGCYWRLHSSAPWLNSFSSDGYTNTTISYYVDVNETHAARSAELNIGGQVFEVTQDAAPESCQYDVTPQDVTFGAEGGGGSVQVSVGDGCEWRARSNDFWMRITSGSGERGKGVVSYEVGSNGGVAKSGTMTIAGQTVTIHQQGAAGASAQASMLSEASLLHSSESFLRRQFQDLFGYWSRQ